VTDVGRRDGHNRTVARDALDACLAFRGSLPPTLRGGVCCWGVGQA